MTRSLWLAAGLAVLALVIQAGPARSAAAREPVRVIFDTDLGADIDDALALAIIHALQDRGQCRLLAVTLTNEHPLVAPTVDVIDTFYGHGGTLIGLARNHSVRYSPLLDVGGHIGSRKPAYPHTLRDYTRLPDAVTLLRRQLAAQPDHSVVIIQVGFSSNLAALLQTGPDKISPLSGRELAERKVKLVSVMGGAFVPIEGNKRYAEYNIASDIPAARRLAAEWPTPIVWSGFEIGLAVPFPATSIERDFGYVEHHPVAEAYRRYLKMPYDRPTWDLTSTLYGILPDRGYFDLSAPGRVVVEKGGATRFTHDEKGLHRHLILRPEQKGRLLEALVQLSSQPPQKGPR